jgi:hypothetical protein
MLYPLSYERISEDRRLSLQARRRPPETEGFARATGAAALFPQLSWLGAIQRCLTQPPARPRALGTVGIAPNEGRRLRDLNPGWAINPNRISSAAP